MGSNVFKEFTKTSLHNHLGGKSADKLIVDNYDKAISFDYKRAIGLLREAKENDFSLVAVTQSNNISPASYALLSRFSKELGICLLPGVELNVKNPDNGKYLHIVVVFDKRINILRISKIIDEYIYDNKENSLTLDQFINVVASNKCVIASHGLKHTNVSAVDNPELISELIDLSDCIPVVIEGNMSYHKTTLIEQLRQKLTNNELKWIEKTNLISTADRLNFKEIKSPTYIWGDASFDDLYYSCFMAGTRIKREGDLINKVNYISKIAIRSSEKTQIEEGVIYCSHGLNCIIGPSGSGKTLLLDIIKKKITGEGLDSKTISKESDYSELYDTNAVILYDAEGKIIDDSSGFSVVEGEKLYDKVISAYQTDKDKMIRELNLEIKTDDLAKRINEFETSFNSYVKNNIKIIENKEKISNLLNLIKSTTVFLRINAKTDKNVIAYSKDSELVNNLEKATKRIESINEDIEKIDNIFQTLYSYKEQYKLSEKYSNLLSLLKTKLLNSLHYYLKMSFNSKYDYEKTKKIQDMLFKCCQNHNLMIGNHYKIVTEKKQELSDAFSELCSLLIKNLSLKLSSSLITICKNNIKKSIKLVNSNYARLEINHIECCIKKENLKEAFPNAIGKAPKIKSSLFRDDLDISNYNSIKATADVFIENQYSNQISFVYDYNSFVKYKILLKTIDNQYEDINNISAGSLSKIYIQKMFDAKISSAGSNSIVLYDQPDNNMEKSFVLKELVDKLSEIRNKNQVFITTHEPLLVVNADSNNIIVANNNKKASKPNSISYSNKSYVGSNSKKELIGEVADLIDGSPSAIKERSIIYGGLINEN